MAARANSVVVVGLQWGDEGKGKIVDMISAQADIVARFQGGNNAGHTLVVDGRQTVLHLIPSGALHASTVCVIGGGVVVDPSALVEELEKLRALGHLVEDSRLLVSQECHLILPYHKAIDLAREQQRGKGKIGTTGRGIGPAYEDKAARVGLRMIDLLDEDHFRARLHEILAEKNAYLRGMLGGKVLDYDAMVDGLVESGRRLRPHIVDTSRYLCDALSAGRKVLFEGAQGIMLDVDHGTYPFVTSSNTAAGAVTSGAGVPPTLVGSVIGISKAYTTRVGSGPFPTELDGPLGDRLREEGGEFGATTGRPRRCGWLDACILRKSVRISGVDMIALTKLDVLSGLGALKICTGYELDGKTLDEPVALCDALERALPIYEDHPGWDERVEEVDSVDALPANARAYVRRIEELVGVPIGILSYGPARDQTLELRPPFTRA
jgi:adenylosuccinate synthase